MRNETTIEQKIDNQVIIVANLENVFCAKKNVKNAKKLSDARIILDDFRRQYRRSPEHQKIQNRRTLEFILEVREMYKNDSNLLAFDAKMNKL